MEPIRVYVQYQPQLYADIFKTILRSLGSVGLVEDYPPINPLASNPRGVISGNGHHIDVVLTSLNEEGFPDLEGWEAFREAKIIALSPDSDYGYRRLPGSNNWEEIRPFRLALLLFEILYHSNTAN